MRPRTYKESGTWLSLAERLDVSRETQERLSAYVAQLRLWQSAINIAGDLDAVWDRHIADSAQVLLHAMEARRWVDLGSGGGLPGLVIAILLRGMAGSHVTLVESNKKKVAFLRRVSVELGLATEIRAMRIEDSLAKPQNAWDVVTARALAPLDRLLELSSPALNRGALGLFLKGERVHEELTRIPQCWTSRVTLLPSVTDRRSRIVRVDASA